MKNKIIAVAMAAATSVLFTTSSQAQNVSQSQINAMQSAMNRLAWQAAMNRAMQNANRADRISGGTSSQILSSQLNAESQRLGHMSGSVAGSVKPIGQAIGTVARKK